MRGRSRPTGLRSAALLAATAATLTLAACGNVAEGPTPSDPPGNLVSTAEVRKAPAGGVRHAFLEYWSALQFQAWSEAVSYYDPSFRRSIGTASIIAAKKLNAPSYPLLKPAIATVTSYQGVTTVKYSIWSSTGSKELASVSWRKTGGNWQIVYDSRLDAELSQAAMNRVEMKRVGALPADAGEISPEAGRAGDKAALDQARYVEETFDLSSS